MNNRYVTKTLYNHLGVTFRSYLDEIEEVHFESSDKVICVSCGNYAGESRQICYKCEVKKNV